MGGYVGSEKPNPMSRFVTRSYLVLLLLGILSIVAGHQFAHIFFDAMPYQQLQVAEIGISVGLFLLLITGFQALTPKQDDTQLSAEREAALHELTQSRTSLAKAQRIAHLGNWDWNIQTGKEVWSDEMYRIFGLIPQSLGTASYNAFLNAVHPDDLLSVNDAIHRSLYNQEPYSIAHRVVWPDGTVRYVHEQGEVEYSDSGEPLHMSGTVLDITERKKIADELRTLNAELEQRVQDRTQALQGEIVTRKNAENESRREREKAERYLSMSGNLLVALDTHGRIEMINDSGSQLLGYTSPKQLVGGDWFEITLPPGKQKAVRQEFKNVMAGQEEDLSTFENEIITRSGKTRMMQWHNALMHGDAGDVVGVLCAATDITAQKQREETLRRAKEEAEIANSSKSGFLSNMSHELRTPMNAILGFSQLMQIDNKNLTETQNEYVDIILSSGNHLLVLINEILDLSRIEMGMLNIELEQLASATPIRDTVKLLTTLAAKRSITFNISNDIDRLPQIVADPARLRQILLNLISNAIKYNSENGQISITGQVRGNGMVRISVHDTGKGIPARRRHELFQPFNRLDAENSAVEGTGVGLVLTKNLVELMDGHVGFDSAEKQGSTFWIELPAAHVINAGAEFEPPPSFLQTHHHRILCVDDNPTEMHLLLDITSRIEGLEVIPAPDAERGLSLAKMHPPDLVIINIQQACEGETAIQSWCLNASPPIPMLALCDCQGIRDESQCRQTRFAACLNKPIHVDDILKALRSVLDLPDLNVGNVLPFATPNT